MNRGQWEEIKTQIEIVSNLAQQRGVLTLSNEITPRKSTSKKLNSVISDERNATMILRNLILEVTGEPERPTRNPSVWSVQRVRVVEDFEITLESISGYYFRVVVRDLQNDECLYLKEHNAHGVAHISNRADAEKDFDAQVAKDRTRELVLDDEARREVSSGEDR